MGFRVDHRRRRRPGRPLQRLRPTGRRAVFGAPTAPWHTVGLAWQRYSPEGKVGARVMTGDRRVLGVDPGLTRCGVAVVDGAPGRKVSLRYIGVLRTDADLPIEQRLVELESGLQALVSEHSPDVVAVERVFSQHNVRTAMATAQAAAVALLVAARVGIDVALHTPTEVKAAVTGSGRADKAQVAAMVTRVLALSSAPKPADAADAAAIAICQAWRGAAASRLAAAQERMAAGR